jgi:hypothetical protein
VSKWKLRYGMTKQGESMLTKEKAARDIGIGVLTSCLLRCGRIDLLIGEQSRFVSQEYRAFDCAVQSKARSHGGSVVNRKKRTKKSRPTREWDSPYRVPTLEEAKSCQ